MLKRAEVIISIFVIGLACASGAEIYGMERNSASGVSETERPAQAGEASTAQNCLGANVRIDPAALALALANGSSHNSFSLPPERKRSGSSKETWEQIPESSEKRSPLKRLGITVTVFSEFEHNSLVQNQEYQKYKNVVDIVGHQGRWNFGAQLRSLVFTDQMRVQQDNFEKTAKFTVYRNFLEYTGSRIQFRAGDFNQSLGNGLVLFLQQDQTLRLDHTVEGGRVGFRWGRLEALFLGGMIDQVTDDQGAITPSLLFDNKRDELLAARVVGHLPLSATVGLNLAQFFYEARDVARQQVGSLDFKVPGLLNRFDVAGEFAATRRTVDNPFSLEAEHGRAIYLVVTGYVLGGTALVEYKNYRDMASPYSNPPNLGRVDDILNNRNVRGFRVRLDRTFIRTGTTAFVSYTQQNSATSKAPFSFPLPNFATLLFAGLEQSLQDDRWYIQANISRRYEKDVGLAQTRAYIDVNRRFWNRHSIGVTYDGRYTDLFLVRERDERWGFSYGLSPYLVFTLLTARQQNISKQTGELLQQRNFSGPEVVFTPNSSWFIKVFVGRLPGGLVCSGGLCRQENPFHGFRSTVSYRF